MTCLEKLRADYPNLPDSAINAILEEACPEEFGYLEEPKWCNTQTTCEACWAREIPYDDILKTFGDKCVITNAMVEKAMEDMEKDMDEVINGLFVGDERLEHPDTDAPRILDSGNRRQFESGAVRDIQEGKGRCDLLPLDVVAEFYRLQYPDEGDHRSWILHYIWKFVDTGRTSALHEALNVFSTHFGNYETTFLEVAIHFEEGAKKYGDNNWRKGIPVRCYIDSGVRHYLKFLRGDKDEPHDRAFCWNIMCAIWTCKHKPELNEYGKGVSDEKGVSKRMPYDYVKEEV